ncbi:enoyl-CoA hydratase-related protein [Falsiroseomonas sp. HW251]|uniref:enoyl-CoA hydratase-related protein n=1 Tax=Falsiroseomonas sp. HW251 TaxID=3390998 RepID=UPI003D31E148
MSDDVVLYDTDGPVATITMNRPAKLNALNHAMLDGLHAALDRAEADPAVRAIILRGAGRAFCSGMDLDPSAGKIPEQLGIADDRDDLRRAIATFVRFWDCPKPTIAQVHGFCIAGGTMLAMACDITLVSADCRIRFPSIPVGGGFVSSFWTLFVGPKKAKELDFVAGSEVTGADAASWGFANHALPVEEVEPRSQLLARQISRTPPDLLRIKKAAINSVSERQGFRQAMMGGADWDAICHFSQGALEMRRRIGEMGLKGAIASLDRDAGLA